MFLNSIKEISCPISIHNLSICEYGNNFLCIATHWDQEISGMRMKGIWIRNYFFFLNSNFELLSNPIEILSDLRELSICPVKDHYFIFGTKIEKGTRKMCYAKFDSPFQATKFKEIDYNESSLNEKNWSPFISENKIYLIQSIVPFIVLELDEESGKARKVSDISWNSSLPNLHAGTRALLYNKKEYLCLCHSVKKSKIGNERKELREYSIWAFTFSTEIPFKILRFSKKPIVDSSIIPDTELARDTWWLDVRSKVLFERGLIIQEDKIIISYGEQDFRAKILILDKKDLEDLLVTV
jgi:hypothetical protein